MTEDRFERYLRMKSQEYLQLAKEYMFEERGHYFLILSVKFEQLIGEYRNIQRKK